MTKRYHCSWVSTLALAAVLMTTPVVQAGQQTTTGGSQNEASQTGQQVFSRIRVIAEDNFIGKPVRDSEGRTVGEIEYLLIDPVRARVASVVVGSGTTAAGQSGNPELRAVPWEQLSRNFSSTGELRALTLDMTGSQFDNAPKVSEDDVSALTTPRYQSSLTDYYLPITPRVGTQAGALSGTKPQGSNQGSGEATDLEATKQSAEAGTQGGPAPQEDAQQTNPNMEALDDPAKSGTQGGPAPGDTAASD